MKQYNAEMEKIKERTNDKKKPQAKDKKKVFQGQIPCEVCSLCSWVLLYLKLVQNVFESPAPTPSPTTIFFEKMSNKSVLLRPKIKFYLGIFCHWKNLDRTIPWRAIVDFGAVLPPSWWYER